MSLPLAMAYEVLQWPTWSDQLLLWYHLPANLSWSDLSSTLHSMFSFTSLHIPSPKLYCHTFLIFNIHLIKCRFLWIGTLFYLMVYPHHVLIISGFFFNLSFIVGNDVYILITGAVRFAFKPESLNVVAKGKCVT